MFKALQTNWFARILTGIIAALIVSLVVPGKIQATSLLYKSYVIRYDRGWDILCEPYEVRPNDWVLKIFRQKGEISSKDFREFLGIFKRLNPHVKNIDRIRPGQVIDIPLKKMDPDTLPGQASGIVTIPFVSLSKTGNLIHQHCQHYRVRKGDTVSRLIARRFGRFGSRAYKEGIKLFKAANPRIKNLDLIYAGQKIYMPDPTIRKQSWYVSTYDKQEKIRSQNDTQSPAVSAAASIQELQRPEHRPDNSTDPLVQVAAAVEGKLYNRGTYYFPRQGQSDFELDLDRYPVLDLANGKKILFTRQDQIMNVDVAILDSYWEDVRIVRLEENDSAADILDKVFEAAEDEKDQAGHELYYTDRAAQITVRARWIKPLADGRHLCVTPIANAGQMTPGPIRRYLDRLGIILKEIPAKPAANPGPSPAKASGQHHLVKPVIALAPTSTKDLVRQVLKIMGYGFSADVSISFPYAGIQVKALSNLITGPGGHQWLLDFGDLYGDAVAAIKNSGLAVIQVPAGASNDQALAIIMKALGKMVTQNPSYLAARRPPAYNIEIAIDGIVVQDTGQRTFLLVGAPLDSAISDMLTANGLELIVWAS